MNFGVNYEILTVNKFTPSAAHPNFAYLDIHPFLNHTDSQTKLQPHLMYQLPLITLTLLYDSED